MAAAVATSSAAARAEKQATVKATEKVAAGPAAPQKAFSMQAALQKWPKPTKHLLAGAFSGGEHLSTIEPSAARRWQCARVCRSSARPVAPLLPNVATLTTQAQKRVRASACRCAALVRTRSGLRAQGSQASERFRWPLRLLSYLSAGVSKTATAPLEAVRIKLMVGQGAPPSLITRPSPAAVSLSPRPSLFRRAIPTQLPAPPTPAAPTASAN